MCLYLFTNTKRSTNKTTVCINTRVYVCMYVRMYVVSKNAKLLVCKDQLLFLLVLVPQQLFPQKAQCLNHKGLVA